jgi:hypothetical protein
VGVVVQEVSGEGVGDLSEWKQCAGAMVEECNTPSWALDVRCGCVVIRAVLGQRYGERRAQRAFY